MNKVGYLRPSGRRGSVRSSMPKEITSNDLLFILLMLVLLVDFLGVHFGAPLLVPFGQELGASLQIVGLSGTLRFLMQALSMIWMPIAADKCGRKAVIMMSTLGTGIAYLMQAVSPWVGKVAMWICGRVVAGIFGGTMPVVQAIVVDISSHDQHLLKRRSVFLQIAQQGLGIVLAPVCGGIASLSLEWPYFCCTGAAGLTFILVTLFMRETGLRGEAKKKTDEQETKRPKKQDDKSFENTEEAKIEEKETNPWLDKALISFLVSNFFIMFYYMGYILLIPKLLEQESFGLQSADSKETAKKVVTAVGIVTLPQGLCSVASSAILYMPLSNKLGENPTIVLGSAVTILASIAFGSLPKKVWHIAVLQCFLGAGFGLLTPAIFPTVAKHAARHYKKQAAQANGIPMFGLMLAGLFSQITTATVYEEFGMLAAWMLGVGCTVAFAVFFVIGHRLMSLHLPKSETFTITRQKAEEQLGSVDVDKFIDALCEKVRQALMENKTKMWNASITNVMDKNVLAACQLELRDWDEETEGLEYLQDLQYILKDEPEELEKFHESFPHIHSMAV